MSMGSDKVITCDNPLCSVKAPSMEEIAAGNGLINMGWWCKGGKHFCPIHNPI